MSTHFASVVQKSQPWGISTSQGQSLLLQAILWDGFGFEIPLTRYRNDNDLLSLTGGWILVLCCLPEDSPHLASILSSVFRAECSNVHEFSVGAGSSFLSSVLRVGSHKRLGLWQSWVSQSLLSQKVGSLTRLGLAKLGLTKCRRLLRRLQSSRTVAPASPCNIQPCEEKKQYYLEDG